MRASDSLLARLRFLFSAVALLVWIAFPPLVNAANTTPDQAVNLTVTSPSVSDNLVGSTGGAYRYFRVPYQGGNAPVLFSLTYQPFYGGGNQAFGFNLYGPSGLSFAGQVTGTNGSSATAQYTLVNGAAMSVLVQVYNYTNGGSVNFTLTVSGLSGGSAATILAQTNTSPEQAIGVQTINASIGGALVGSPAGTHHFFNLSYPGGDSALSVTMNVTPVYSGAGQAVGFHLYRQIPNKATQLVSTGSITAQDSYSQTISATVSGRSAAVYQLEVYNYWPDAQVSYGITVTGLAGPAASAGTNLDDRHAIVLNSARPGATGTIVGNRGGAYNYFLVTYPGNNSQFALSLTYPNDVSASAQAVGFNVYDGSNLVATANPSDDGSGVSSGEWLYKDANPKTFGVQVFNYVQNTPISYTLYQIGAQ